MTTAARRRTKNTDSPGIKLEVDGKTYVVREADISPKDVRVLRRETGFSWAGLAREMQSDPDIDLIAALVWFARHLDGDSATYDDVLGSLSYDSDLNIGVEDKRKKDAAPEDESPEA